jgi:hypothetical protein
MVSNSIGEFAKAALLTPAVKSPFDPDDARLVGPDRQR